MSESTVEVAVIADQAVADAPNRRRLWWIVRAATAAAVAASVVIFYRELPDAGALWRVTTHASPWWLAGTVLGQLASMGMFARVQRRLLRSGGVRMSLPRAVRMTYAGNALSTSLPAGPAVSVAFNFRQYRRAGATPRVAAVVVVLGGVIMTTAYTVVGLVALLAEPRSRVFAAGALAALAAAIGAVVVLWRVRGADATRVVRAAADRAARHRLTAPLAEAFHERGSLRLSRGDWAALTGTSLGNWVFDILSLAAAGRAVGVHAALYAITIAYFAAQAAGSLLPILPGGLGAIEGSLAASLVAFGTTAVPAGAAVALYRLVSFWGVVGAGWLAWLAVRTAEEGPAGPIHAAARRVLGVAESAACAIALPVPYLPPQAPATEPAEPS